MWDNIHAKQLALVMIMMGCSDYTDHGADTGRSSQQASAPAEEGSAWVEATRQPIPHRSSGRSKANLKPASSGEHTCDADHPAGFIATVTPIGHVQLLVADSGEVRGDYGDGAVDIAAVGGSPARLDVATTDEQGQGVLRRLLVTGTTLQEQWAEPWSGADLRLLRRGDDTRVSLVLGEGTRLIVGDGDDSRSVGDCGSWITRRREDRLLLGLLDTERSAPTLAWYDVTGGSIRAMEQVTLPIGHMSCAGRLVRGASDVRVAMTVGAEVVLADEQGGRVHLNGGVGEHDCVEDAVQVPGRDEVLILTGPRTKLHWASALKTPTPSSGEATLAGQLWHDPSPRRRLAVDEQGQTAWVASSDELSRWDRDATGRWRRNQRFDAQAGAEVVVRIKAPHATEND